MKKFSKLKDYKVFGSNGRLYWSQLEDAKIEAKQEGIDLGKQQGILEGKQQGIYEEKIGIAKKMLTETQDLSFISRMTKLSIKEIKKLQNK